MKKLALLVLVAVLSIELASAKVFFYDDEVDYRSNVGYALSNPWKGIDLDVVGDFDNYNCISADDYNSYAGANQYDAYDALDSSTASRDDLKKLRRADQLSIVDEDPYDSLDREDIDNNYDDWSCYTLKDYNSLAREDPYDSKRVVDFTHFDDIYEVQEIGMSRYNNFFQPDDFNKFNLQYTQARQPYYEPYDYRDSPYPLYGYGIVRREDY